LPPTLSCISAAYRCGHTRARGQRFRCRGIFQMMESSLTQSSLPPISLTPHCCDRATGHSGGPRRTRRVQWTAGFRPCFISSALDPPPLTRSVRFPSRHMQVSRKIPRNRRIPNRATDDLNLVLKWPSGSVSWPLNTKFSDGIRHFRKRIHLVPIEEQSTVTAYVDVSVRKAGGGVRRVILARWTTTDPLPEFFRKARLAYNRLPKERDDEHRMVPHEIRDI